MNWATRLRRGGGEKEPPGPGAPVEATAATVLPAPVACSNQKRRLAPGSSGASSTTSSSSSAGASCQSCGSSSSSASAPFSSASTSSSASPASSSSSGSAGSSCRTSGS